MSPNSPTEYLYRGTIRGWPGSYALQSIPMTCTSTDPLVATLFAILFRKYSQGSVIILVERGRFSSVEGPLNLGFVLESAVNLKVAPLVFERNSDCSIVVEDSIEILANLGFSPIASHLSDPTALRIALERTYADSFRLNDEQVVEYDTRALETCRGS